MIATLGMYDRPEIAAANDALWAGIRGNLGYGPDRLDRSHAPMEAWQSPDLLFSHTCGMPYRTRLHGHVQLVGTPDYGLPDADPGYYYSVFVVRNADRGDVSQYSTRKFAFNDPVSQSGWAAAQNFAQDLGFQFHNTMQSGGHLQSATMVAQGLADIASIDAVSWRLICACEDMAKKLKVIQSTAPTPGLPFICAGGRDVTAISKATSEAIENLSPPYRDCLGLRGMVQIAPQFYLDVPTPAPPGIK